MAQLENIEAIEKRLWKAADTLRANSNYASNEYFMPVMGLIFLRHAYSRYMAVKDDIIAGLPTRGGKIRPLSKEDFSQKSSIFLQEKAQFDYLVSLPDDSDWAKALIDAMESIESDYESLRGVLPKSEYRELDDRTLGQLLRTLNPEELKKTSGDIFGRIYEYFLTQFADQKAHDGGEFFTPVSLVSLIANILEPEDGTVLDPACGSGGMFVQSAHFVERQHANPTERLTFYGLEKNQTTIHLARMNLAVHGLEGDIKKAITYYDDPHELHGKADFVMANPPFNVDEVDAESVKRDPRLPFGLPGVNKAGKVSNGNYLWISYFYSYLNEKGRAGFVMSSQASSAGRDEAKVRQKLIETGAVDIMVAIRTNFFYTRTVPCELWFLNKAKPAERNDKVLMIDARNVYRKVTRKIYDFNPEQQQNILAIVWLYRGQAERFLQLVTDYLDQVLTETDHCFTTMDSDDKVIHPMSDFMEAVHELHKKIQPLLPDGQEDAETVETEKQYLADMDLFKQDVINFEQALKDERTYWTNQQKDNRGLNLAVDRMKSQAETSRDLIKDADLLFKLLTRLLDKALEHQKGMENGRSNGNEMRKTRKVADEARQVLVEQLKQVRYFWKQAHWLTNRFPEGQLCEVPGLVKMVDRAELGDNDWSLTPGRYVGVAPEEVDEDFDFEETMREIHLEIEILNGEASELADRIKRNFEELGI